MRTLIPQLHQLILIHAPILFLNLASRPLLILSSIPPPHKAVDGRSERNHAQRHGVSANITRLVRCRADACQ